MVESDTWVCGWRLCDLLTDGNLMGSRTKNTGFQVIKMDGFFFLGPVSKLE
jgi:hypothetical protein